MVPPAYTNPPTNTIHQRMDNIDEGEFIYTDAMQTEKVQKLALSATQINIGRLTVEGISKQSHVSMT